MASLKVNFGRQVKKCRNRRGLTQSQLAEKVNRSLDLIGRIERGDTAPSFETIEALMKALSISAAELMGGAPIHKTKSDRQFLKLVDRLSELSDEELKWLSAVVEVALKRPR